MLKRYGDKGNTGCLKFLAIFAAVLAAATTVVLGELIHVPWHIIHTLFPENVSNSRVPSYIM